MLYDIAVKKAERLLRRNLASIQEEVEKLEEEGFPVEVTDAQVTFTFHPGATRFGRGQKVAISLDGEVTVTLLVKRQDGHWEEDGPSRAGGVVDVAHILQEILEDRQALAKQAGTVAEELAKH